MVLNFLSPALAWPNTLPSTLSSSLTFTVCGAAIFFLSWLASKALSSPARNLPYPPGPPPKDFISGNARELSESKLWFPMADWAAKYGITLLGPIMHLRSFNTHMVVLNSFDDAMEILEKRSNNYSDRPYVPMIEMVGWTFTTAFKRYGPDWHAHRRLMHQTFRPAASVEYRPTQVEKVNDMLHCMLETPEDYMAHIKTLAASIVMSAMYGYKVSPKNDYFTELAEAGMSVLSNAFYPGAAVVNILPILRYLPAWFPGTDFHRVGKEGLVTITKMQDVPYKYVRDNIAAGTASPCFVTAVFESCKTEEEHTLLKEIAATGYAAGADTTVSSLGTFMYAMAMFPEVQKKAQEELDRVIGQDRLVNYDDEHSLPYIQALVREVFRWRPVLPLGVFHSSVAEDVFKGYYIPKGTSIVANVWAITRDPVRYPNPEEFNPDRFFVDENTLNKDDMTYTFGFGRRVCPGRHLATATVWLSMATILMAFDIRPPKDASGKDIALDVEYTGGLISHPKPFKCSLTPRSDRMRQLIVDLKNSSSL
ncbi:cytochrome P450 [Pholiota conissans]|uniref:Cytochrome P450 n=1 Tax=Pholiota conissans TaxID=109636 RepID=A0A9P5Z6E7_9AGAR|nr:cytochrome P450 [Pholiota conissans]